MSVGSDTYAHDVLETCGGENVCGGSTRYPVVALEEVEAMQPEVVLLPDEPYPFCAEDLEEFLTPLTNSSSSGSVSPGGPKR